MIACTLFLNAVSFAASDIDLKNAVIVIRPGSLPNAEASAATVLVEEIEKRTRIHLETTAKWPEDKPVIAISSTQEVKGWKRNLPARPGKDLPEQRTDGYRLFVDTSQANAPLVWIIGADPRGALYGAGALLRHLEWAENALHVPSLDIATAPMSRIRGHQLGYRATANSWDAWDAAQFDQYIREMTFFGINAIEGIPFQDDRPLAYQKSDRRTMNRKLSEICDRYGLEYWVWTPADFDLKDQKLRAEMLKKHEELYRDCKELSAIFFPGGDPGDNDPKEVLPFLEDLAKRLKPRHPKAKIWLSMQGFTPAQTDAAMDYIAKTKPEWLGGLCEGPSSPPIADLRKRLPKQYGLRMYPDITHNKLSQYPVPWWDQAYALTLGREAINPRPVQYAYIHNWFAPYCDGFISYSDGVHDDVNKTIWSAMSWDTSTPVREVLADYARVFFGSDIAEEAADGILALEKNWRGPLLENGSVDATLEFWQQLEPKAPQTRRQWRWQMCLVRAYYDAYVRRRLLNETKLEDTANAVLLQASARGSEAVMTDAQNILNRAVTEPVAIDLRGRIVDLYEDLFQSISLQSSVEKYSASGGERGASLDYIDIPLNNRWWLEDEFTRIRALSSEAEKCENLMRIATWAHPGPGCFYDDIGNTANSPHVQRAEIYFTNPAENALPEPTFWWSDNGKCRKRLSWQITMDWPDAVVYEGLDPDAQYTIVTTGYGKALLKVNGKRVEPTRDGTQIGEFKEFPVPNEALKDRKLVITWDKAPEELQLNWRQWSRVAEIWLLKQGASTFRP